MNVDSLTDCCKKIVLLGLISLMAVGLAYGKGKQQVKSVRVWDKPSTLRVVFDLTGPVKHRLTQLKNPDRVVIDIQNAVRTRALLSAKINNTPIKKLRSAPRNKHDLRIVLDLKYALQQKSFLLKPDKSHGYRLVVDLKKPVAKGGKPAKPVKSISSMAAGRDIVVVIDAGHGGADPGAIGPRGTKEKVVVLQIAKLLAASINKVPGYKAVLTRRGDYFLKLSARRELARSKYGGDLFISIHADAFDKRSAKGASVFALSTSGATSTLAKLLAEKENRSDMIGGFSLEHKDNDVTKMLYDIALQGTMDHGRKASHYVLTEMGKFAQLHKKRVEQAGFVVLKSPDIPSLLIETGFISNPAEEKKLRSRAYQQKLANAITSGVIRYFNDYPPPNSYISYKKNPRQFIRHSIARGETLSQIAAKYRVSASKIRRANALNGDLIRVGQVLRIPHT